MQSKIKLEEYFEVFAADFGSFFQIFIPIALPLGMILIVLEVVLGVAVLINYRMKLTALILLVLIVFFTFLTGYSAILNKVTDCGCFCAIARRDPGAVCARCPAQIRFLPRHRRIALSGRR